MHLTVTLPWLYEVAVKALPVPAISAPVKRVFICCNIYATTQITNDQQDTSDLVFLKCNLN